MTRSIPLAKALDDCLVAYRMNGEMLRPEQGYPARLVVPGWEGNVWVKWLRRIKLGDEPWFTREETVEIHRPDGERQSAPVHLRDGREIGDHLAVAAGAAEAARASLVISGLAWSGRGSDQARRRLARRRPQLASGADRRAGARQGLRALLCRDRLERRGAAAAIARHRRRPATCSRPRTSCARSAASTRSTTTTASRPGRSSRTGRSRMSKWLSP